ncbi:ABC transporter permease [Terrihabitans soli]|uniref:ABC transporter permease n=1 Tax=Terrihabitans soli TaxID=708113 RepID=A0A6S6QXT3_9HYPH|nr:iron ABC transporter permease [Terrihabitans soli]BCJ91841.1 ABC transporter permease [Terrihabitans soli]
MTDITAPSPSSSFRLSLPGFWLTASLVITALVLAPVIALTVIASHGSGDQWPHLIKYVLPVAVRDTASLLLGVGALAAVLGVGTAWLVTAHRFPGRNLFDWALLLPLAIPTYIMAYASVDLMHPLGPVQSAMRAVLGIASPADFRLPDIRSMWGAILLFGLVLYPYVYLATRAMFLMQSACVIDVSRTLGAGRAAAFFRVALPLARPAIAVGVSLVMMEALNDLGASDILGVRTLTVSIYSTWVNNSSLEGAAQIAIVMLFVVVALVLIERYARRHQRFNTQAQRSRRIAPRELTGLTALGASLFCLFPICFGFLFPALYLVREAIEDITYRGLSDQLLTQTWHTVSLAAVATIVTVLLGLTLTYTARLVRGPLPPALVRLGSVGYAIPGTVLAVGLLVPLAAFDNAVDAGMRQWFGISTGLLLSGSGFALVYAYAVRFLAISAGGVEAGFQKISPSLDSAARNLGETSAGVVRRVHMPLLRPALGAAALLVFVDAMKELSATLLLRPFNFETLATHVYAEASRGTYEDGSVAALLIVLVGLLPVALLARASRLPLAEGARAAEKRPSSADD